jgi:YVTN family beta-propeller protein
VVNTTAIAVTTTTPAGKLPLGLAVSPNNGTVYAANYTDNTVSVINAAANKVPHTIPHQVA